MDETNNDRAKDDSSNNDNEESKQNNTATSSAKHEKKRKRAICKRCDRPTPRACICESLPSKPITLKRCRVVVLQHPHENKRKNRSLPLVELCIASENNKGNDDFYMKTVNGRRLGEEIDTKVMSMLQMPNVMLVYPDKDAVPLDEGIRIVEERLQKMKEENTDVVDDKITLLFLDATWKYAKEMNIKNTARNLWPKDIIRVQLLSPNSSTSKSQNKDQVEPPSSSSPPGHPAVFIPKRFNIRTPPSDQHLSTAETLAWVVSVIEDSPEVYETLMKPLDYMVQKWHSFSKEDDEQGGGRGTRKRQKLFE